MKRRWWWFGGFFIVLIAIFYIALFAGTDYYKSKLPVLNHVQPFSFTDQNGKAITNANLEGKVYVAEYFFTTCKGICPKMNENMKTIFQTYKNEQDFAIISHTSMPETDSVGQLKFYEKQLLPTGNRQPALWYFVTGSKDSLYKMARESYLLDNEKNNSVNVKDQFIHTQFFALVDKQSRIRGIYDALKNEEIEKLKKDIKTLLKEKADPPSFNHSTFSNNPL